MHLSDMTKMGLRSCVERSVYWHGLAERLTLLEERRNERVLFKHNDINKIISYKKEIEIISIQNS